MDINWWIIVPSVGCIFAGVVFWTLIGSGIFKPVDYFIARNRRRMEHQR